METFRRILLLGAAFMLTACVNNINEEDVKAGDIPIHFKVKMKKATTRINETAFEQGDKMGLYALINGKALSDERYFSNEKLTVGANSELISANPLFYPKDDTSLDFVSYYPYQQAGIAEGATTLEVGICAAQNNDTDYENSQFLTAAITDVSSDAKEVKLSYSHKFVKLNLILVPENGESVTELLAADPYVVACGFYTRADYDFAEGKVKNFRDISHNIVANGAWKKTTEADGIMGKSVVVMPQPMDSEDLYFTLEYNGVVYNCPFPAMQELAPGNAYTIKISTKELQDNLFGGVVAEVSPWEVVEEVKETDDKGTNTAIHIASLSFRDSNIYHIYRNGGVVAEVCKEYLSGPLNATAITAYPVKGTEGADRSNGMVLQVMDGGETLCGGKLSWSMEEGAWKYAYTHGNVASVETIYIDSDNQIEIERPTEPAEITIVAHVLMDIRGAAVTRYALVKIGAQCWMREELAATCCTDGTELVHLESTANAERVGFYREGNGTVFYTGETLLEKSNLPADGWRIPRAADFEQLMAYLDDDASLLKAGTWKPRNEDETLAQINNKAQFFAYPVGGWSLNKVTLQGVTVAYWATNGKDAGDQTASLVPYMLQGGSNEISVISAIHTPSNGDPYYKSYPVRLIKG